MQKASRGAAVGWLIPVLLLAAAVRLYGLGSQDLWGDEAFSVVTSLGPLHDLLGMLATAEPHPPLYPFLLAGWLRAFGSSEFSARLPSAFEGIASVAVAAALARSFAAENDRRGATIAAVIAGLLVALNPFQVWYSQEARMYAQVSFFGGLATLALRRLWHGQPRSVIFYTLAIVAAAGSHYYGLFVGLGHGLAVLTLTRGRGAAAARWFKATTLAAVLYLPWLYVASHLFVNYFSGSPAIEDLLQIAEGAWVRVAAGWSLTWDEAVLIAGIVTCFILVGMIVPARSDDDRFLRIVLVYWLFTPFVAGYAISLVHPLFTERYLMVSSLPMILFVSRGIAWLLSPGRQRVPRLSLVQRFTTFGRVSAGGLALAAILVVVLIPLRNVWKGEYIKSAYNTHVRTADLLAHPGDAVILDGMAQLQLYQYYARTPMPLFPLPKQVPPDPVATANELANIARTQVGAWVFWYDTPSYDPDNVIGGWLAANAYRSLDTYAWNARLQYYRFVADSALTTKATNIAFGDAIDLVKYGFSGATVGDGDTIAVELQWQPRTIAATDARVALRLVDSSSFTWAQTDDAVVASPSTASGAAPSSVVIDRHGLLVPDGTPPGDYLLLLNVYDAQHPQSLLPSGSGAPIGPGGVTLATIHVSRPSKIIWTSAIGGFSPTSATFPQGVSLLGYAESQKVTAGESGYLTLVWRAVSTAPAVAQLRFELIGADGKIAEQRDLPFASSSYLPAQWQAGDVLREQYRLPISDQLAAGTYRVEIAPSGATSTAGSSTDPVALGSFVVQPGTPHPPATAPQHPLQFSLAGKIALAGYDLTTTRVAPGGTVDLTLHWNDVSPADVDYTVFVHVLDPAEKVVAQRDQPPAAGKRPTSSWFPGDAVLDNYQITLPAALPPGDYAIEVGMYNPSSGDRLPVTLNGQPAGDRIIVTKLQVGSSG